ncbi:MAG: MFS transporter [Patescibacteria group bacterium]|nr:MFS transporter [Patescibacteria group bacterium]
MPPDQNNQGSRLGIHPDIWKLGAVSFLTDVSSEAIFSVFSVFFTVILGASTALLGMVEGFADFSSSSLDYISGWLSDRSGKRKPFALIGYGFSALAKASLVIAQSIAALASFRIVERLGKSFRGSPRDAWLGAVAEKSVRGYSFGVHNALDKAGAVAGPLLAYATLAWLGQTMHAFRILFLGAVIVALAAVIVLTFVKDRPGRKHERENIFMAWQKLDPQFKRYLIPAGIFSLAYFSFGFLLLRAYALGFSIEDVVLLYALFNAAFVAASIPVGKLGDRIGRKYVIMLGYAAYIAMSLGFIFATQKWEVVALFLLFGIFYSIDEAQNKAFITDLEQERRASAIGLYNFATGLVYLPASVIAGLLWAFHPTYAFGFAAAVTFLALVIFVSLRFDTAETRGR